MLKRTYFCYYFSSFFNSLSIKLFGRYLPPTHTPSIFLDWPISCRGFPPKSTRLALEPALIVPESAVLFKYLATLIVPVCNASKGERPESTRY